jgi:beta-galactosidase/beta-glucuronidase
MAAVTGCTTDAPARAEADAADPAGRAGASASGSAGAAEPPGSSAAGSSSDGGDGVPTDGARPPDVPGTGVLLSGRRLWRNGEPLVLRGACWNPVGVGDTHPAGLDFAGFVASDAALMRDLGLNVVRTYEPILDAAVLDELAAAGLLVINQIYPAASVSPEQVAERVRAVRGHPAIVMWALGNEWNYNGLYAGLSPEESLERINRVAAVVKAEDPDHPVATIYGELPNAATIAALPNIDVWGINSYRGIGFGALFSDWAALSDKPMFLAEYGADAYDALDAEYDPESQADAVVALTEEILDATERSETDAAFVLGGLVFEWADEWWKDESGNPASHDVGGFAPGGGPHPDGVFNEEWWGLMEADRTPRAAFTRLRALDRSR